VLTPEGIALLWSLAAGASEDRIPGWSIVVSDGQTDTAAAVAEPVVAQTDGGAEVTLTASYGEGEANHEWARRQVVSGGGVVVDTEDVDMGRKAQGTVSGIEVTLELAPGAE
jgi:predicted NUDIX family NTP pyrophosphohydrolase